MHFIQHGSDIPAALLQAHEEAFENAYGYILHYY